MENNNANQNSNTNTILIVIGLMILVGAVVWLFTQGGTNTLESSNDSNDAGAQIELTLPGNNNESGANANAGN